LKPEAPHDNWGALGGGIYAAITERVRKAIALTLSTTGHGPLTVVAGTMREPLWRFVLIVTLAKGGRYVLLAALVFSGD